MEKSSNGGFSNAPCLSTDSTGGELGSRIKHEILVPCWELRAKTPVVPQRIPRIHWSNWPVKNHGINNREMHSNQIISNIHSAGLWSTFWENAKTSRALARPSGSFHSRANDLGLSWRDMAPIPKQHPQKNWPTVVPCFPNVFHANPFPH